MVDHVYTSPHHWCMNMLQISPAELSFSIICFFKQQFKFNIWKVYILGTLNSLEKDFNLTQTAHFILNHNAQFCKCLVSEGLLRERRKSLILYFLYIYMLQKHGGSMNTTLPKNIPLISHPPPPPPFPQFRCYSEVDLYKYTSTPSITCHTTQSLGKTSVRQSTLFLFASLTHEVQTGFGTWPLKARLAGSDPLKRKHQTPGVKIRHENNDD